MKPRRIQRKRVKGWKLPPNTVYVGRRSKWGNLWKTGLAPCGCRAAGECDHNTFRVSTPAEAVTMYREWIESALAREATRGENHTRAALNDLRGKNLACWCPLDQPCHADVLLELANQGTPK